MCSPFYRHTAQHYTYTIVGEFYQHKLYGLQLILMISSLSLHIACTLYIMSDVSIIGLPSAIIIILINNCELKNLLIGTMLDNCTCGHKNYSR